MVRDGREERILRVSPVHNVVNFSHDIVRGSCCCERMWMCGCVWVCMDVYMGMWVGMG